MDKKGKTRVYCVHCGHDHFLTPSAMAIVIEAVQEGYVHTSQGHTLCVLTPLSTMDVREVTRRWRGAIAWTVS